LQRTGEGRDGIGWDDPLYLTLFYFYKTLLLAGSGSATLVAGSRLAAFGALETAIRSCRLVQGNRYERGTTTSKDSC